MKVSFGQVDGNGWESYCQKLLRMKYSNYQEVPAQFGGDLGIEGFTRSGIVFQCYCPDEDLAGDALYEKQRDKITTDINKLIRNVSKIYALGTGSIKEWYFLTPRFNNRQLLDHCRAKEAEVKAAGLTQIDPSFAIFIRTEDDYIPERQTLLNTGLTKIHPSDDKLEPLEITAFLVQGNEIVSKIDYKLRKLQRPTHDAQRSLLTQYMIRDLLVGRQELERLNQSYPDVFRSILSLKASKEAQLETISLTYSGNSGDLLKEALQQYELSIKHDFGMFMDSALISRLSSEAIADWLGRCPLDFPDTAEGGDNAN